MNQKIKVAALCIFAFVALNSMIGKRIPFSDVRNSAVDDRECYLMMDALELLRKALADVGYAPR